MNRMILLLVAAALTACARLPLPAPPPVPAPVAVIVPPPPPPPCPPPSPLIELMDYYQQLRQMSAAELQKEQATLLAPANLPRGESGVIQLAMLASLNRTTSDWGRLLPQLDALQKSREPVSAPYRSLAALLHATLSEQRRLDEQNERTATLLREEQRRREGLEEREAALQEKLEGLKAIERNLLNRPQGKKP